MHDLSHVVNYELLDVQKELSCEEVLVSILDIKVQKLRTKEIPLVKIQWLYHGIEDVTWEAEAEIKANYLILFA